MLIFARGYIEPSKATADYASDRISDREQITAHNMSLMRYRESLGLNRAD